MVVQTVFGTGGCVQREQPGSGAEPLFYHAAGGDVKSEGTVLPQVVTYVQGQADVVEPLLRHGGHAGFHRRDVRRQAGIGQSALHAPAVIELITQRQSEAYGLTVVDVLVGLYHFGCNDGVIDGNLFVNGAVWTVGTIFTRIYRYIRRYIFGMTTVRSFVCRRVERCRMSAVGNHVRHIDLSSKLGALSLDH